MGAQQTRQKDNPNRDDVIDMLRVLAQAYREEQRISSLQLILKEVTQRPAQKELLKKVAFRDKHATVNVFEQIFRAAMATYAVSMKSVVVALTLKMVTGEDVRKEDQDALVNAGVSHLVLDVYAFSKAYKAPLKLIEDTSSLVDLLIMNEGFCDQFIGSGGSKILFNQLVAPETHDATRQKAIKTLRQLSTSVKYLKLMSESGGVSALIKALSLDMSREFALDALKIITTLCRNNAKLLAQLLEIPEHICNILNLLSLDDISIIQDTMFILYNMTLKEKTLAVIHECNGFSRVYSVFISRHPQSDPRLLYHTVGSISALLQFQPNCEKFYEEGGLHVLWGYLEKLKLAKSDLTLGRRGRSPGDAAGDDKQVTASLDVAVASGEDDGAERKDSGKVKLRDPELSFE
eukprot:RCo039138